MTPLLPALAQKDSLKVIGLMSGTSMDGVDAALCKISGTGVEDFSAELLQLHSEPYSRSLLSELLELSTKKGGRTELLCRLHYRLGQTFARAAEKVLEKAGLDPAELDLIGCHGQTVAHLPPRPELNPNATGVLRIGATLQICEPAVIAEALRVPVISNFRARDIAAGGQGAPLVPYVDYLLFSDPKNTRALVNIGGISNITHLPAGGKPADTLAFDSGPGNMIIDCLTSLITHGKKRYDANGDLARKGMVDGYILSELLKHPYLKVTPPKSTGREEFGEEYARWLYEWGIRRAVKTSDILRTVTDFTAISLGNAYRDFLLPRGGIDEIIVSGGGALNKTLMDRLRKEFEGVTLLVTDEIGMPLMAKEAIAFAILARETALGRPSNMPSVTGAAGPRILGQLTPP